MGSKLPCVQYEAKELNELICREATDQEQLIKNKLKGGLTAILLPNHN